MKNFINFNRVVSLALLLIVGGFYQSCKPKEGCNDPNATNYDAEAKRYGECIYKIDDGGVVVPDTAIKVNIVINAMVDGKPFELNKKYTNKLGKELKFTTLKFYMANIKLALQGENKKEIKDIELFDLDTSKPLNPAIPYWNNKTECTMLGSGKFDQIYLGIGVGIEENEEFALNKYPADHPLSGTYTGMAWDWGAKYIFSQIEGMVDSNGNGSIDRPFFFHSGHSSMYRLIMLDFDKTYEFKKSETVNLTLDLDVMNIIDGLRIETDSFGKSHTADLHQRGVSTIVQTNLSRSLSLGKIEVIPAPVL